MVLPGGAMWKQAMRTGAGSLGDVLGARVVAGVVRGVVVKLSGFRLRSRLVRQRRPAYPTQSIRSPPGWIARKGEGPGNFFGGAGISRWDLGGAGWVSGGTGGRGGEGKKNAELYHSAFGPPGVRDATLITAGPRSVAEWRQRWPWELQRPATTHSGPAYGGNEIGRGGASIGLAPVIGPFRPAGPLHQGDSLVRELGPLARRQGLRLS